jgi:hypothetical protein
VRLESAPDLSDDGRRRAPSHQLGAHREVTCAGISTISVDSSATCKERRLLIKHECIALTVSLPIVTTPGSCQVTTRPVQDICGPGTARHSNHSKKRQTGGVTAERGWSDG